MTEAVEWLDCWDTHYMSHLSPESYTALRKISVEHKCYDADDAIHYRHTGRIHRSMYDGWGRKGTP